MRSTPSGLQAPINNSVISSIVTRTPPPPAQCPLVDPDKKPSYQKYETIFGLFPDGEDILEQLNTGVASKTILFDLGGSPTDKTNEFIEIDLTGDKIPELVIRGIELYVFGCVNGQYQALLKQEAEVNDQPYVAAIADMNLDGLPEIVTGVRLGGNNVSITRYEILEWNGFTFQNMVTQPDFGSWYPNGGGAHAGGILMDGIPPQGGIYNRVAVYDSDGNGTTDLIITGGIGVGGDSQTHGPWRWEKDIYTWDGHGFALKSVEMEPPTYEVVN
ncbi:MAG: hypothetical protein EHM70_16960 [Chloroflexota bacterium]|nr:MAG: hypothetical protein EHM70_16960 [Chloroflexota bacterium]